MHSIVRCSELIARFGGPEEQTSRWGGRRNRRVFPRAASASGGKLTRVEAVDIREITDAPYIDLNSVLDPDFTAGMDLGTNTCKSYMQGNLAKRVHWDSCTFLGLINQEPGKVNDCSAVWKEAEVGCWIYTSFSRSRKFSRRSAKERPNPYQRKKTRK